VQLGRRDSFRHTENAQVEKTDGAGQHHEADEM
jgi:hypothetical protein